MRDENYRRIKQFNNKEEEILKILINTVLVLEQLFYWIFFTLITTIMIIGIFTIFGETFNLANMLCVLLCSSLIVGMGLFVAYLENNW